MAQGIKVPLEARNGRLAKQSGDDYISQLVVGALLGEDSDNPFQEGGLGEFMIFGINDRMSEGEIRERISAIFESLKADQLARIDDPARDLKFRHEGEVMWLDLTYVNMETQERPEVSVPIPAGE